jgi:hypothetical protein
VLTLAELSRSTSAGKASPFPPSVWVIPAEAPNEEEGLCPAYSVSFRSNDLDGVGPTISAERFFRLSHGLDRFGLSSRWRSNPPYNRSRGIPGLKAAGRKGHLNPRFDLFPARHNRLACRRAAARLGPPLAENSVSASVARRGAPPEVIHRTRIHRSEWRRDKTRSRPPAYCAGDRL